jgi:uncharacterized protein (DUF433 family)
VSESNHSLIRFRDTAVGPQASVRGTRLLVWHAMMVARDLDMDPARVAEHLQWPLAEIQAAFRYAEEHPEEIWGAVEANDAVTFEDLQRILPHAEQFWFWSDRWQEMEREADADIDAGRVQTYGDVDAFIDDLENSV